MSLFPTQSPMTVQMRSESRCRAFEQQERAFFALPEATNNIRLQAPLLQVAIKQAAYGKYIAHLSGTSKKLNSTQGCLPRPTRTIEHPSFPSCIILKDSSLRPATDIPTSRNVHGGQARPRLRRPSSAVFTGSARRARRQATIARPNRKERMSPSSGSHTQVSAVEARRVDKATGVTWIEVEYRARSSQLERLYSFQNIVSEASPS